MNEIFLLSQKHRSHFHELYCIFPFYIQKKCYYKIFLFIEYEYQERFKSLTFA